METMTLAHLTFSDLGHIVEGAREEKGGRYLGPLEENTEGRRSLGPDLAVAAGIGSSGDGPEEASVRRLRLGKEKVGERDEDSQDSISPRPSFIPVPAGSVVPMTASVLPVARNIWL